MRRRPSSWASTPQRSSSNAANSLSPASHRCAFQGGSTGGPVPWKLQLERWTRRWAEQWASGRTRWGRERRQDQPTGWVELQRQWRWYLLEEGCLIHACSYGGIPDPVCMAYCATNKSGSISNANATGSHIVSHFRGQNAKRWLCTRMGPERDGSGVLWLRQRSGLLPWLHSSKSTWVVGLLCSQPCTTWEQPQGNQSREFTVTAWDPGPLLPVLAGHNPFWAGTAWAGRSPWSRWANWRSSSRKILLTPWRAWRRQGQRRVPSITLEVGAFLPVPEHIQAGGQLL